MDDDAKKARREYNRKWREANQDHIREYKRNWNKRNKDKTKQHTDDYWKRKAQAIMNDGVMYENKADEIKPGHVCQYCGKEFAAKRSTAKFCSTKCRVYFNRNI